jgi:hypothetical protein
MYSGLSASDANRKTFLAPRATGVNLPMEYTTWHGHVYGKKANSRNRTSFQVTPFFQGSTNEGELGEYFAPNKESNSFIIDDGTKGIAQEFLIHQQDMASTELAGTVSFRPDQEAWGVRLDFFQDINTPWSKFFLTASAPIVSVERDMDLKVVNGVNFTKGTDSFSIEDFFKGNVTRTATDNLQDPLKKAKINGDRSETGLADIDVAIGHKCIYKKNRHLFLNIGVTIPTGTKVRGDYLWAPVVGNGRHVGLGAGVDAGIQVWKSKRAKAKILFAADYRYLFESTEERTIGLKKTEQMGHYYLVQKINAPANTPLFPAANVLTQDVRVKPGSQIDAMIDFSFMCSKFTIDFGYNMFWKDQESVWVKNWTDNTYAQAKDDFKTSEIFDLTKATDGPINLVSQGGIETLLDVGAATSPAQLTHKIFGGVGYTFNVCCNHPLSIGAGASYEFVTTNAALENYSIWIKGSVSF